LHRHPIFIGIAYGGLGYLDIYVNINRKYFNESLLVSDDNNVIMGEKRCD